MPTILVNVDQQDHSSSRGEVRGHSLVMDRPEAKGGQDKGPMGGEAILMGLGGCFMSNLLAAARARDVEISEARAEIAGELSDGPMRYTKIRLRVSARCEPADALEKLVTIADRGCIAANTLRNGVNLSIECVD
jgi:putative redox protein